jgi:hypothetical protein
MRIARRIRTLNFAELALKAAIHNFVNTLPGKFRDVAIVVIIQQGEQIRKAIAKLKAHPAAITDLKHPLGFLTQGSLIPIRRVIGIVAHAWRGLVGDMTAHEIVLIANYGVPTKNPTKKAGSW